MEWVGVLWNGLESIGMDWAPMEWIRVQLGWIEVQSKSSEPSTSLNPKMSFLKSFLLFHKKRNKFDQILAMSAPTWMAWGQLERIWVQCLFSVSFSGLLLFYTSWLITKSWFVTCRGDSSYWTLKSDVFSEGNLGAQMLGRRQDVLAHEANIFELHT